MNDLPRDLQLKIYKLAFADIDDRIRYGVVGRLPVKVQTHVGDILRNIPTPDQEGHLTLTLPHHWYMRSRSGVRHDSHYEDCLSQHFLPDFDGAPNMHELGYVPVSGGFVEYEDDAVFLVF